MSKKTIAGLTVEIGGDTTKLGQALSDVDKRSAELSRELGEINKLLKLDPTNTELLAQKQTVLSDAIKSTKERLDILKAAHEQAAEAAANGNAEAEEKMRALEREIISTEQKLGQYEGAARETESALQGLGSETEQTADSEKDLGKNTEEAKQKLEEQKKAAADARKELGDMAERGADKAAKALTALVASAAATATALAKLVIKEGENADELGDMSAKTGISTEKLQEYRYVAELAGTSLETMTGAQAKLVKNMASARKGTGDTAKAFEKLKIKVEDSTGELRDHDEVFGEVLQKLAEMPNETERDALAMQILGKSAQDLNPLIKAGADNIDEWTRQAHELGIVVSSEATGALNDMYQEAKIVDSQFAALKQNFASQFAPAMTKLMKAVQSVIKKVQDEISKPAMQKALKKLSDTVTTLIERGLKKGVDLLPKIVNGSSKLLSHIKEIAIGLGSVWVVLKTVSVVTNAAKAFNTLKTAFDTIKAASSGAKAGLEGTATAAKTAGASVSAAAGVIGIALAAIAIGAAAMMSEIKKQEERLAAYGNEIADNIKSLADDVSSINEQYSDTVSSSELAAQKADEYIDRLEELEAKGKLTAAEQREYNKLLLELQTVMPGVTLEVDKQTGLLKGGATALRDQVTQWQKLIRLEAAKKKLTGLLEKQLDLEEAMNDAIEHRNKINADYYAYDAIKRRIEAGKELNEQEKELIQTITAEYDLTKLGSVAAFKKAAEESISIADDAIAAYQDCSAEIDKFGDVYIQAATDVDQLTTATEGAANAADDASEAVGGENGLTEALESARKKAQELVQSHFEHLDDAAHNMFSKIREENTLTIDQIIENLRSNIEATRNWNDNLARIIERGAPQEMIEMLEAAGIEAAGTIANIANATDEEFQLFVDTFNSAGETAVASAGEIAEAIGKAYGDGLDESGMASEQKAEWIAKKTSEGFERGLIAKKKQIAATAGSIASAALHAFQNVLQIRSPSRVMEGMGEYSDEGYIIGMKNRLRDMLRTARDVGGAVSDEFRGALVQPDLPNFSNIMHDVSLPQANANSFDGLNGVLDRILAAIEAGKILAIDGDKFVGATVDKYDAALGRNAVLAGRGA